MQGVLRQRQELVHNHTNFFRTCAVLATSIIAGCGGGITNAKPDPVPDSKPKQKVETKQELPPVTGTITWEEVIRICNTQNYDKNTMMHVHFQMIKSSQDDIFVLPDSNFRVDGRDLKDRYERDHPGKYMDNIFVCGKITNDPVTALLIPNSEIRVGQVIGEAKRDWSYRLVIIQ